MASVRTQQDIEQDVASIDRALSTVCKDLMYAKKVSDIRSSLRQFIHTVECNPSHPSYIHQFSDGLNKIKRDLNRQAVEGEHLKGALEYAHQVAQANAFDWPAIKEYMGNEVSADRPVDMDVKAKSETGNLVKNQVDRLFSELSCVVLPKSNNDSGNTPKDFITQHFDQWMASDKERARRILGKFLQPEQQITSGSVCTLEISVQRVLTATLDLEYHHASDSLIIHRYEIKSPKEDKPFWQESRYNVFQKINLIATSAFEEMTLLSAREALVNSLNWLSSYYHLFSEPCHRCRKRLQFDSPQYKHLPPVIRTWNRRKNSNIPEISILSSPPSTRDDLTMEQSPSLGLAYHLRCYNGNH
ncbi:hypothetical protein [Absidia glauca]|uniref:Mediator of RNA polymerase II transcription subunit 27 n=1 Tax=Absidia glauca TaxID=4829 RepID=A0A163MQZ5_ABSGL|nr:hypothetical protein [Absidia glauca]